MASTSTSKRAKRPKSFRVGRVRAYRRGRAWHVGCREHGRRRQPRVGPDRDVARQTAAEINAQVTLQPSEVPGLV